MRRKKIHAVVMASIVSPSGALVLQFTTQKIVGKGPAFFQVFPTCAVAVKRRHRCTVAQELEERSRVKFASCNTIHDAKATTAKSAEFNNPIVLNQLTRN